MAIKLASLQYKAANSVKSRGHKYGHWQIEREHQQATWQCDRCYMEATVIVHPKPNEIDIGGRAVALNCLASK